MIMEKNGFISRDGSTKVYKIGRYAPRKDAKRHHVANIISDSEEKANEEFLLYVTQKEDCQSARYELCTGDWKKVICVFS